MTFNVEAFIRERVVYSSDVSIHDDYLSVEDVRDLVAQLVPPGHVVVPRAEPKCECDQKGKVPVCASFLENPHNPNRKNKDWCLRKECLHDRRCHTPAPAAKEVMPRSE